MKHFLIYVAAVLLPVLAFFCIGEVLARQVPNSYRYKEEWMESHHNEVETLVLGTSHSLAAVKPDMLDKEEFGVAFNLASFWQLLHMDYFLWQKFDCPKLKTLLLPISYPTLFFEDMETSPSRYRVIYYKLYMGYPAKSLYTNFEFSDMSMFTRKLRRYILPPEEPEHDEYGWTTSYRLKKKKQADMADGKEATTHTREDWEEAVAVAERNYAILQHFADDCKRRNIKLVLFTTPAWHTYRELVDERQLAKMHELIARFQQQNEGVLYFDYLSDPRFVNDDFYNSNHLSDVGAEKFTKILSHDILANQ